MAVLLRIRNWAEAFENNRTRELKNLNWVPMPNRQDGDGYTELMDHPKAASHYGAWCAMVQVASRCDPRGTLLRDRKIPHDSGTLSRITRIPKAVFDEVIPRLLTIGWLESLPVETKGLAETSHLGAGKPQDGAGIPQDGALNERMKEGNEGNGKKGTEQNKADAFERFWVAFPSYRKSAKAKAKDAWDRAVKKTPVEEIISAAIEYAASPVGQGEFVKGPEPWLNGECWHDDRASWQRRDTNGRRAAPKPLEVTVEDLEAHRDV